MQKTTVIAVMVVVLAFGVFFVSVGIGADVSSVPDKGFVPPDRQIPSADKAIPDRPPSDENYRPQCVIDSSLLDGRSPQAPQPGQEAVGSFQCQA